MKFRRLSLLILLLFIFSCSKNDITLPPYNPEANLENTDPIDGSIMKNMEGIYWLNDGNNTLGVEFVCKVSKHRVSFFSNQSGIYMIMKYGLNPTDSSIQFAGFWRYSENVTQGKIGFSIAKDDGASELLHNGTPDYIKISATFLDVDLYTKTFTLQFHRHFTQYSIDKEFAIFAHHGI
jgi:hypothetical protein